MALEITLIFPHQLFVDHPGLRRNRPVYLLEDSLFFRDPRYPVSFHKHKLMLHIATMDHYREYLEARGFTVKTVRFRPGVTIRTVLEELCEQWNVPVVVHICDVIDFVLEKRLEEAAREHRITVRWYESPLFLSPRQWVREQLAGTSGSPPKMHRFYVAQRQRMGILLEPESDRKWEWGARETTTGRNAAHHREPRTGEGRRTPQEGRRTPQEGRRTPQEGRRSVSARSRSAPVGGRWSFDDENRKPWPARRDPPPEATAPWTELVRAAAARVDREFPDNPGDTTSFWYPVTHEAAREWFERFLEDRFTLFGRYEDAISAEGTVLYHSVLSPVLNIGLVTPVEILKMLDRRYPLDANAPREHLPGLEGFVRQIIGWREYIRGIYLHYGVLQRTTNAWAHHRALPASFYRAATGLHPVDTVIRRVVDRSYCHHIERLMVLGNMMMLCEIDPDAVYRWFMELFIDAYDWVMVPNVYGMSQFADGGLLATKPYISGANYIRKMSNYPRGDWEETWTALFWRFLDRHRSFFSRQPRMNMLVKQLEKDSAGQARHRDRANRFLDSLD